MSDPEEPLTNACLHALLVLLDFAPTVDPSELDDDEAQALAAQAGEDGGVVTQFNVFRSILRNIADTRDFDAIFSGICAMLASLPRAEGTMLPYALHSVSCYPELLVLLWKVRGVCAPRSLSHAL